MKQLLFCLFLSSVLNSSYGQNIEKERIRYLNDNREKVRQRSIYQRVDSGLHNVAIQNYKKADTYFQYAIANLSSIPSDLVFYFGKNSFFLGKYKQSIDWLSKYIQLKGTNGIFSAEAAEWQEKAEAQLIGSKKSYDKSSSTLVVKDYINCGESGMVTCPVCNGTTVIVESNQLLEKTYSTCKYCNNLGRLACEDYNKLMKGQLLKKINN